jgi:hypothetical protein
MNSHDNVFAALAFAVVGAAALLASPFATTVGPDLVGNVAGTSQAERAAEAWLACFERAASVKMPGALACGAI